MISGQIETRPLPVLLYQLLQQRFTGEIAVQTETGAAQVYLTDGALVQIVLPDNRDLLGQVLRDAGVLSDAALRRALATPPPPGQRIGDVLLAAGLEEVRLIQGLRLQIGRRLGRLFLLQRGGYLAVPGAHQRGLQGGIPVLTPVLWATAYASRALPLELLRSLLGERLRGAPRLNPEREAQLNGYGFDAAGVALVQALRRGVADGGAFLGTLAEGGSPAQSLLAALYTLDVTDALRWEAPRIAEAPRPIPTLELDVEPGAPGPIGPAPSTASRVALSGESQVPSSRTAPPSSALSSSGTPRPVSLAERALLAVEIEQRCQFILDEDPFSVLGVLEDADSATIEAAYAALQQQYGTERLVQLGLGGLVRQATRLLQRFAEAHDLLRIPAGRAEQRKKLALRAPEQEALLHKARARLAFSRGVVLLRNREFALSIPEFKAALRYRPEDGEAEGHLAWAEYGAGLRGRDECRQRILAAIERAPTAAPLYYFAGVIYKVEGDEDSALKCFAECCRRDAKSQAAASELRLLLLRKVRAAAATKPVTKPSGKSTPPGKASSQSSGFFAGLLKPSGQSSPAGKASAQSQKVPASQKTSPGQKSDAAKANDKGQETAALLDALKQATSTEELLALWQRAEKALPDTPRRSTDSLRDPLRLSSSSRSSATPTPVPTKPPESAISQRRGLDFLRRPLGESLRSLVDLLQQPLGGSSSSASLPRSSASSASLPRQPSSTPTPTPGSASSTSLPRALASSNSLPRISASSTSLPRTGSASSTSLPRGAGLEHAQRSGASSIAASQLGADPSELDLLAGETTPGRPPRKG